MKAHLLFPNDDFAVTTEPPSHEDDLTRDLGVDLLVEAMADGDQWFAEVARHVVLQSLTDRAVIQYRQELLGDCLGNPRLVRELYDLAVSTLARQRKVWRTGRHPDSILHGAVQAIELFVEDLRHLRAFAEANAASFASPAFGAFFATVTEELDDAYFEEIRRHLVQLEFRRGVTFSSNLGPGNKTEAITLRVTREPTGGWFSLARSKAPEHYTFRIPERDDAGFRALGDLRGRAINDVANALAQSADHVTSYFIQLRFELAFYLGCVNLHAHLNTYERAVCWPTPTSLGTQTIACRNLCDVGLCLRSTDTVVGNDVDAAFSLIVVTGANQGGKSTFLRSVGLAQLMMQCGMFVTADRYAATPSAGIYTHYRREEDAEMNSGKLDEELRRMNDIAEMLTPHSLVLFNESFAATNEREGSEIARQVVHALLESQISVIYVTHLHDLADSLQRDRATAGVFLRADRESDGRRTFRLVEGEPLPTAYGLDLYDAIFDDDSPRRSAAG